MESLEIAQEIVKGEHDLSLEIISGAIKDRMRVLGIASETNGNRDDFSKFNSFQINDKVVFNNHAWPSYLIGVKATIVGKKQKKVLVRLANPTGRFVGGSITCPVSIIDKIRSA